MMAYFVLDVLILSKNRYFYSVNGKNANSAGLAKCLRQRNLFILPEVISSRLKKLVTSSKTCSSNCG